MTNDPILPTDVREAPAPPPMGHNNPPPYDTVVYAEYVEKVQKFTSAASAWLDLVELTTNEQAQYLTDYVSGARKIAKALEEWRKDAKEPHRKAAALVDDAARIPAAKIDTSIATALKLMTAWQVKEKARLDKIAADERAAAAAKRAEEERNLANALASNNISGQVEAEAAIKDAAKQEKAADKIEAAAGQVKSASGGGRTVALVSTKHVKIERPMSVFMFFANDPAVLETLQRLANAHVRAKGWDGKDIPGTQTYTKEEAR